MNDGKKFILELGGIQFHETLYVQKISSYDINHNTSQAINQNEKPTKSRFKKSILNV